MVTVITEEQKLRRIKKFDNEKYEQLKAKYEKTKNKKYAAIAEGLFGCCDYNRLDDEFMPTYN